MEYEFNTSWTLYFHEKNTENDYIKNILKLIDINNIKDFWGTINNIPKPLEMFSENGCRKILRINKEYYVPNAYSLFKSGFSPTWENTREGSEICLKTNNLETVNYYFNELCMVVVCEADDILDNLTGIRVVDASYNHKNNYKLEIWFNNLCNFESIKEFLNSKIEINAKNTKILYREHLNINETKNH